MHDWKSAPPIPDCGDDNPEVIYCAVGKIMTAWETIEFELSRLYSVFVGDPDGEAMREYGAPATARGRLDNLAIAARKFFVGSPSQEIEGQTDDIICVFRRFSARRNEVAHGIVLDVQNIEAFASHFTAISRGKPQYALISPYHQIKRFIDNHGGIPAHAYTAPILQAMGTSLALSFCEVCRLREHILAGTQSR